MAEVWGGRGVIERRRWNVQHNIFLVRGGHGLRQNGATGRLRRRWGPITLLVRRQFGGIIIAMLLDGGESVLVGRRRLRRGETDVDLDYVAVYNGLGFGWRRATLPGLVLLCYDRSAKYAYSADHTDCST